MAASGTRGGSRLPVASRLLSLLALAVAVGAVAGGVRAAGTDARSGPSGSAAETGSTATDARARGAGVGGVRLAGGKGGTAIASAPVMTLPPGLAAEDAPSAPQQSTVVMVQDFEGTFPAQGWTVFDNDDAAYGEYYWDNRCTGAGSARSAWSIGGGTNGRQLGTCRDAYPAYADSWMAYGPIDFSNVTDAALDFAFWLNSECVGTQCSLKSDRLWILHSTNGRDFDGPWYAGDWYADSSAVNGWVSDTVDLSALAGEPRVWIAFAFRSDASTSYQGGAFVDDVALRVDVASCPPATASVRTLSTDRSCYAPGAQIGVFVDVATTQPGQSVKVEAQLGAADVIWASQEVTFAAPGQRVVPLTVPAALTPGTYDVRAVVWDAASECYQAFAEIPVTIDPACGIATDVPVTPGTPATPKPPPCPNAAPVDVVFVMDTSASMDDEFQALCGQISSVVAQLQALGVGVNYRILGITETRACATEIVAGLLPGGRSNDLEDWAPAVADLAERYSWRSGHIRLVIPMSDEGPDDGNPVYDPGSDRDAVQTAINLAKAANVVVSPVLGSGHEQEPGIAVLAADLAAATGGSVFESTDPASDLADGIAELIGTAACTPVVSSVEPPCIQTASETVRIRGANFLPGATVEIGGRPARSVVRVSETEITCVPDAALFGGSFDVTVVNPPGGWRHTLPFALQIGGCAGTATATPTWTPRPTSTPTASATFRPTATPTTPPPPTLDPSQPPCPDAGPVDVVFAMDTSGSMDDEFDALCGQIGAVVTRLQQVSVTVRYRIVGINEPRACASETVVGLVPGGATSDQEDWGPAVADLAARYGWTPGHARLIVPVSDEGPEDGSPVNDPGNDRDAINAAIVAARANRVIVSPVLGTGYDSPIEALAQALAAGTGGRVFKSSDPASDLAQGIANLIGAAACTPTISSVEPPCVETAGETIRIHGSTFMVGATVEIGGRPAQGVIRISDTELACRPDPAIGQGRFDVKVINPPGGWSHTAAQALQIGNCSTPHCPAPRPQVDPLCPRPNYVRDPGFELGGLGWWQWSSGGRPLVSTSGALDGFRSALFVAPPGLLTTERLYQFIDVPPDATSASFWVADFARAQSAVGSPPPPSGYDLFRASLVDAVSGLELVRLWDFDPTTQCDVDESFYNLTATDLDRIRGRKVILLFELRMITPAGYSAQVAIDNVHFTVCTPSPPCRVEGGKTAHPTVVDPSGEVTVVIDLAGIEGACLTSRPDADVVLVLDRSGSMSEGNKIGAAKTAAEGFVDRMDLSRDRAALVSFADGPTLDQALTDQARLLRDAIARQVASGGTDILGGLEVARTELHGVGRRPGSQAVVVLLSDGQPTTGDPRPAAQALKDEGTRLFTIGLGADVDPNLMRDLATSPADYFFAPGPADLQAIYEQVAGAIGAVPATNLTLVDRLSSYVELVPGSFSGSPPPSVSRDGRTLTWAIPRLGFETRVLSYRVRMTRVPGLWPTNDSAVVTYTNSHGQPATFSLPVPQVRVLEPPPVDEPPSQLVPEVMCRDHGGDDGSVPSNRSVTSWWDSPDIWVRNQPDSLEGHQNPVTGATNYVHVRVRNIGTAEVRDIEVFVYEAVGGTNLRWPDDWAPGIGSATVRSLAAGASTVVRVPWVPKREGHFCFLVRIQAAEDPIRLDGWVPFDNNICQRNVQIVSGTTGPGGGTTSSTGVSSGNRNRGSGHGSVTITSPNIPPGARVVLEFEDPTLFERWQGAGGTVKGGNPLPGENAVELEVNGGRGGGTGDVNAEIDRLPYRGEETSGLRVNVELPGGAVATHADEPGALPVVYLVQRFEGQVVGGNVLWPTVGIGFRAYLPVGSRRGR